MAKTKLFISQNSQTTHRPGTSPRRTLHLRPVHTRWPAGRPGRTSFSVKIPDPKLHGRGLLLNCCCNDVTHRLYELEIAWREHPVQANIEGNTRFSTNQRRPSGAPLGPIRSGHLSGGVAGFRESTRGIQLIFI